MRHGGDEGAHHTEDGGVARTVPVVFVAYNGSPMSETQVHLACRSANDTGSLVRVLHVVERSRHVPLDVPLSPDEHAHIDALLDRVERIAPPAPHRRACRRTGQRADPAPLSAARWAAGRGSCD